MASGLPPIHRFIPQRITRMTNMKANPDVRSVFYLAAIAVPPTLKPATVHYAI
jgi:hypothetical protein